MDQPRLNFLKSFISYKNNFYKFYNLLAQFELTFQEESKPGKTHNNNYYYIRKIDKKISYNPKLKLTKSYSNQYIKNILFF